MVKDSINFLDHINGKKHQRNLGMSMRVERSSLEQVKARFASNKKKNEDKEKEYNLSQKVKDLKEEVNPPHPRIRVHLRRPRLITDLPLIAGGQVSGISTREEAREEAEEPEVVRGRWRRRHRPRHGRHHGLFRLLLVQKVAVFLSLSAK